MIDRLKSFQDLIESGAWPLLVGDMNCLVNFGNEREQGMIMQEMKDDEQKIERYEKLNNNIGKG